MTINCIECNKEFDDYKNLHIHIRSHKITMADYYIKHFPRNDLFNREPIPFENREQYFSQDFISKENQREWLKNVDENKAKEYCKKLLINRKTNKNLIYTPTQVELRTLMNPSIVTYAKLFGDYFLLCEQLGFINRFKNEFIPDQLKPLTGVSVITDTREKNPLKFKITKIEKLDYGDYALDIPHKNNGLFIERKSLPDLIGTISKDYERFLKEIERAADAGKYLVILVTESLDTFNNFNLSDKVSKEVKSTPQYISHRIREIIQNNFNCQFLFVNGENEALRIAKVLLLSDFDFRKIDLQYNYDLVLL